MEFTDKQIKHILWLIQDVKCGYCLDGLDPGAEKCPECGLAAIDTAHSKKEEGRIG